MPRYPQRSTNLPTCRPKYFHHHRKKKNRLATPSRSSWDSFGVVREKQDILIAATTAVHRFHRPLTLDRSCCNTNAPMWENSPACIINCSATAKFEAKKLKDERRLVRPLHALPASQPPACEQQHAAECKRLLCGVRELPSTQPLT